MLKLIWKVFIHVAVLTVAAHLSMVVGTKIWPDMKEKPPAELFTAGAIGAFLGLYIFYSVKDKFGWGVLAPQKTDPVLGPAPKPIKTYEDWKEDLDKVDGQDGLEEFLERWSGVPRTEKGAKPELGKGTEKGPSGGKEIPNTTGIPPDVTRWIDQSYERAYKLYMLAHPEMKDVNPRP